MRPQDQIRMEVLCSQIASEKDPRKLLELVKQLNNLLEGSASQASKSDGAAKAGSSKEGATKSDGSTLEASKNRIDQATKPSRSPESP
jgi:hypothetical protein